MSSSNLQQLEFSDNLMQQLALQLAESGPGMPSLAVQGDRLAATVAGMSRFAQ